jgi:hypothetical protein
VYLIASHNGYETVIQSSAKQSKESSLRATAKQSIPRVKIETNYPGVKSWLDTLSAKITKRTDKGETPYNLRDCSYMDDFFRQKIIYPNMTSEPCFIFDKMGFLTNQKCFILVGNKLKYLSSILNSKILNFYLKTTVAMLGQNGYELSKIFVNNIPIPMKYEIVQDEQDIAKMYSLNEKEVAYITQRF